MTCREKDRERERDSERGGGEGESESASERGPLVATPGVYYKGGIKYTGCQKMKCHPTAFLVDPLSVGQLRGGATVSYGRKKRKSRNRVKPLLFADKRSQIIPSPPYIRRASEI